MLYLGYWFSAIQTQTWNYICRSVTYISSSSDFPLYLEDYLMDSCDDWNISSMWFKDLPHKMCVCQWPTFYGPTILSYTLKTVWWMNIVLGILIQCDTNFDLKYIYRSVISILCTLNSESVLYHLEHDLMIKPHSLDIGFSVTRRLALWNIYGSFTYISWLSNCDWNTYFCL